MSGTPLREKSLGVRSGCSGKRRLGGEVGWEKEREERREEWLYERGRDGSMEPWRLGRLREVGGRGTWSEVRREGWRESWRREDKGMRVS